MRILSGGNVGIGINAPTNLLHTNGSGVDVNHQFTNTATGSLVGDGTIIGIDSVGNTIINNREALPLIVSTSGVERMRVLSGGNVGIGEVAPTS